MQSISPLIAATRCLLSSVQARARVHILCPSPGPRSWTGLGVLALALTLALSPRAASAQTERLSLRRALDNALAQNKRLVASGYRIAQQNGRVQQAGLLPNPELNVLIENVGGQGDFAGTDSAEITISIAWAIEPGLRGRRMELAQTPIRCEISTEASRSLW